MGDRGEVDEACGVLHLKPAIELIQLFCQFSQRGASMILCRLLYTMAESLAEVCPSSFLA